MRDALCIKRLNALIENISKFVIYIWYLESIQLPSFSSPMRAPKISFGPKVRQRIPDHVPIFLHSLFTR